MTKRGKEERTEGDVGIIGGDADPGSLSMELWSSELLIKREDGRINKQVLWDGTLKNKLMFEIEYETQESLHLPVHSDHLEVWGNGEKTGY